MGRPQAAPRATRPDFLLKSCAPIWVEIAHEKAVFACLERKIGASLLPLGIFRVAKHAQPCLERPSFVPRKVRDGIAKRHVSQQEMWNLECGIGCVEHNVLNIRRLGKIAENGVFQPNVSIVEKKCVVLYVDCCDNWVSPATVVLPLSTIVDGRILAALGRRLDKKWYLCNGFPPSPSATKPGKGGRHPS